MESVKASGVSQTVYSQVIIVWNVPRDCIVETITISLAFILVHLQVHNVYLASVSFICSFSFRICYNFVVHLLDGLSN
jgi:hypothetical protein